MALVTAQTIIDRARVVLKDAPADTSVRRWTDTELMRWLNDGYKEMVSLRPNLYCNADETEYTTIPIPAIADISIGDDLRIHSSHAHVLLLYVAGNALGKDAEEGDAALAKANMDNFYAKMGAL